VELINDISGKVFNFIGVLSGFHAGYVLTYNRANDEHKTANLLSDALAFFGRNVDQLHRAGISDVIIDPGFGFGQTVEESLSLLDNLSALRHIGCPILAGISRKRMAYQLAGLTPDTCLDETLRLERIALAQGVRILRVHDVAATKQMITQIANE
jgi:dihydropteroate synthase